LIVLDFEVLKYDWLVSYLDLNTKKKHSIVNDVEAFKRFYAKYKDQVWVGYNIRGYDQWIAKAILCGFDPYEMNNHIIVKKLKGFMFSDILQKYPILSYDTIVGFKSLKELEAYMGHDIKESNISWNIDRKLTDAELKDLLTYCEHDVWETFEVFIQEHVEYESHVNLLNEFKLGLPHISKTKAQLSAEILGANRVKRTDEFDLVFPSMLELGKHSWIKDFYVDWSKNNRNYKEMTLQTTINDVPHDFGMGGLHSARKKYVGEGIFILADFDSYYPAMMIEYGFLSRNVWSAESFREIRDDRINMKHAGNPMEYPRKIVLNSTFGASKDKYNKLYDPLQANNTCVAGQLLIVDLLDKLEGKCELIQSNTDGILLKVDSIDAKNEVIGICETFCKRTRMTMGYDEYKKIIQKDVNNYIMIETDGGVKRKGGYVKKLKPLDNDLPIVNRAIVAYLVDGIPVEDTVNSSTDMIDFQKVTKIGGMYKYVFKENTRGTLHKYTTYKTKQQVKGGIVIRKWKEAVDDSKIGAILNTKVNRCFASTLPQHGGLYKHKDGKESVDKIGGTPEKCFIENGNILGKKIPYYLDREWYIKLAKTRIKEFTGEVII